MDDDNTWVTEELVGLVRRFQAIFSETVLPSMDTFTLADLAERSAEMVAVAVVERQVSVLRAAVELADLQMGHLAIPFVRPACEELIWLTYLAQLEEPIRSRLILLLQSKESTDGVNAQQQFLGAKTMRQLGFPKSFVNKQLAARTVAEDNLKAIGETLHWEDGLPSVGWIANQVGLGSFYSFFYSASSKGVHFSPSELFRSAWTETSDSDSHVSFFAEQYRDYRTEFCLHWLTRLLLESTVQVDLLTNLDGFVGSSAQEILELAELIGSKGKVPIVHAGEFNLRR